MIQAEAELEQYQIPQLLVWPQHCNENFNDYNKKAFIKGQC